MTESLNIDYECEKCGVQTEDLHHLPGPVELVASNLHYDPGCYVCSDCLAEIKRERERGE